MSKQMQAIDVGERANIMKLKNESKDPNLKNKVEWLYTGDKIDREAYLLGKPIDKILLEKEIEKPNESTFKVNTIDLANKIREDPLFEIKKQEIEAKKRLLENPLKVKQLKQMISQSSGKSNRSTDESDDESSRRRHHKNKKKKKSKKKHHKKRESSSSSRSSSESDDENGKHRRKHKRKQDSDTESDTDNRKSNKSNRKRSRSRSRSPSRNQNSKYGLVKANRREDSQERDKRRDDSRERQSEHKAKSKAQIEIEEYKNRIEKLKQIRTASNTSQPTHHKPTKLTEEERQRRLEEMQQNAQWRNEVRDKNVTKYRMEEKRDEELDSKNNSIQNQQQASKLFNNIMRDAYISTEDRIKRNIKNIQRNESAFDKNFARK